MKQRKFYTFIVLEFLAQYYFVFGLTDGNLWFASTMAIAGLYFTANTVEGIAGKEKKDAALFTKE